MDYSFSSKLRAIAIVSAIAVPMAAGAFLALPQAYSQKSATLSDAPTIKDIGDATTSVVPDQATALVNVQTQPDDLADVLEEQEERIEEIRSAVQAAAPDATISIGYRNISPYYTGYGTPVNDEVTFNVYATTTIQTNID
jgi:uncharacterized protein YggE